MKFLTKVERDQLDIDPIEDYLIILKHYTEVVALYKTMSRHSFRKVKLATYIDYLSDIVNLEINSLLKPQHESNNT